MIQPSASRPQKARKSWVGRPLGAIAPSRSQTSFSGSAETGEAARHAEGDVFELLREDERAGDGARVGQLASDDVAPADLAPADPDLRARLAEVELGQLAGAVAGALEAARRRQKARPQLAQQVVEHRLAAV
jgi:hypothetical protein